MISPTSNGFVVDKNSEAAMANNSISVANSQMIYCDRLNARIPLELIVHVILNARIPLELVIHVIEYIPIPSLIESYKLTNMFVLVLALIHK